MRGLGWALIPPHIRIEWDVEVAYFGIERGVHYSIPTTGVIGS
jgi:hypothetical protein